jgi:hypothetical protein
MRHESTVDPIAAIVAGLALTLVVAGCGGAGTADGSPGDGSARPGSARADEPVRVATPRGTDEIYEEIVRALDAAYSDLGSPPSSFEHLSEVQDLASKQLAGEAFEWPSGTSYSLSVLDDRVAVYINCDGREKRGHWLPGGEADGPS